MRSWYVEFVIRAGKYFSESVERSCTEIKQAQRSVYQLWNVDVIIIIIITSSSPVGAQASRAPPSRRKVAVVSHAQYVFTVNAASASRVKAAVGKTAW